MIEHNAQQPDTNPPYLEYNTPEEGSELVEEPDQRRQEMLVQHELINERIRFVIICVALIAIILSAVLFLFTRTIVPLFIAIVVIPLLYRGVDMYLDKSEASTR